MNLWPVIIAVSGGPGGESGAGIKKGGLNFPPLMLIPVSSGSLPGCPGFSDALEAVLHSVNVKSTRSSEFADETFPGGYAGDKA